MTALAIFHLICATVLSAELVERPTKLEAVSFALNAVCAAVYLSKVMP